jgi:hypothetical protein
MELRSSRSASSSLFSSELSRFLIGLRVESDLIFGLGLLIVALLTGGVNARYSLFRLARCSKRLIFQRIFTYLCVLVLVRRDFVVPFSVETLNEKK